MELIRGYKMLSIWMVVASFACYVESRSSCKPISLKDIQDAATCSEQIYTAPFKKGSRINGAPGYIVDKVISNGFYLEPLKVIIAKKASTTPPTTMVCFMGTKSAKQLLSQFHAGTFEDRIRVKFGGKYVAVMAYFWNAFNKLIEVTTSVEINDKMKYIVTGHSLGGALASLFSIYMIDQHGGAIWKNPYSTLITFGQPRVGDKDYAKQHDFLIKPFRKPRIVYNMDIVPHIPPQDHPMHPTNDYVHTSREIWIEVTKNRQLYWTRCGWVWCPKYHEVETNVWHVCPNGDGSGCSNGASTMLDIALYTPTDHGMVKYKEAIVNLKGDTNKVNKFIQDQC